MKRIVITGATSGIGLRLAETYAAKGWRVGMAGRRDGAMKELKELFPEQVEWIRLDVTKNDAPRRLMELIGVLGGMDAYLHVAGVYHENPALKIDEDVATVETNVTGYTRMIDAAYHYFRKVSEKGGQGHIAIISSVAGTKGIGRLASYSASKRYQQTYLEAVEQLAHSEKVNLSFTDIRPGFVRTPLLNDAKSYPMTMTLDHVVPMIVKAISRRSRIAVVDRRWAAAVFFWRLIPGRLWVKMNIGLSSPATKNEPDADAAGTVELVKG